MEHMNMTVIAEGKGQGCVKEGIPSNAGGKTHQFHPDPDWN